MIEVSAIKCDSCGNIVFSRARHDCRDCSCGNVFIDGGRDYTRVGFRGDIGPKTFLLKISNQTKESLYDDWAKRHDKMGIISFNDIPLGVEIIKHEGD